MSVHTCQVNSKHFEKKLQYNSEIVRKNLYNSFWEKLQYNIINVLLVSYRRQFHLQMLCIMQILSGWFYNQLHLRSFVTYKSLQVIWYTKKWFVYSIFFIKSLDSCRSTWYIYIPCIYIKYILYCGISIVAEVGV